MAYTEAVKRLGRMIKSKRTANRGARMAEMQGVAKMARRLTGPGVMTDQDVAKAKKLYRMRRMKKNI